MADARSAIAELVRCARCGGAPRSDEHGRIERFVEVIVTEPREMLPGSGFKTVSGRVLHHRIHVGCLDEARMVLASG
jgi:hypothetical protein